ncbi:MAG: hypothetical protein Q9222_007644 [Ikaeria aurantiellina]
MSITTGDKTGGALADEAAKAQIDMELGPNKIEWRSRVDERPLDLKEKFTDQFKLNEDVYVKGARGFAGPWKIDQVLGNGQYKLRKQDGEKIKKQYDEGDLSYMPKLK